jgi:hypothetical protein
VKVHNQVVIAIVSVCNRAIPAKISRRRNPPSSHTLGVIQNTPLLPAARTLCILLPNHSSEIRKAIVVHSPAFPESALAVLSFQNGTRSEHQKKGTFYGRRLHSPPAHTTFVVWPARLARKHTTLPIRQTAHPQRLHAHRRAQPLRRKRPHRCLRNQHPRALCGAIRRRASRECGL